MLLRIYSLLAKTYIYNINTIELSKCSKITIEFIYGCRRSTIELYDRAAAADPRDYHRVGGGGPDISELQFFVKRIENTYVKYTRTLPFNVVVL